MGREAEFLINIANEEAITRVLCQQIPPWREDTRHSGYYYRVPENRTEDGLI